MLSSEIKQRLWNLFLASRVFLSLILCLAFPLHIWALKNVMDSLLIIDPVKHVKTQIAISIIYFLFSVFFFIFFLNKNLKKTWDLKLIFTTVLDVFIITYLIVLSESLRFTPLFALPVFVTACLGSTRLSFITTLLINFILFYTSFQNIYQSRFDAIEQNTLIAMTCIGYFVIIYLVSILIKYLNLQNKIIEDNKILAITQEEIGELIISNLKEGIIIVKNNFDIYMSNKNALNLLNYKSEKQLLNLKDNSELLELFNLVNKVFLNNKNEEQEIHLYVNNQRLSLFVKIWLSSKNYCLIFLQDLREIEAKIRTEKLASMGRISTAVAHEIRNPLSAITQANEILLEELKNPQNQKLSNIIKNNSQRLARIIEDILDSTRIENKSLKSTIILNESLEKIIRDWQNQNNNKEIIFVNKNLNKNQNNQINFSFEDLRRIIFNLLNNALNYGKNSEIKIMIYQKEKKNKKEIYLKIWNQGEKIDYLLEQHLFEPFFSSNSRSSGLGLYICRQLCANNQATINYNYEYFDNNERDKKNKINKNILGNSFIIKFTN